MEQSSEQHKDNSSPKKSADKKNNSAQPPSFGNPFQTFGKPGQNAENAFLKAQSKAQTLGKQNNHAIAQTKLQSLAQQNDHEVAQSKLQSLAASNPFLNLQAKLSIGSPDDPYEREADQIAHQVVQSPTPVQTKCAACGHQGFVQTKSLASKITPLGAGFAQKKCSSCQQEEEQLQAKFIQKKSAGDHLESQIQQSKGGGSPMDSNTASWMSGQFGADFSNVRIHNDSRSAQMNQDLGARAFTVGNDIHFNHGQYHPGSQDGQKLLAHELTHVVQQNGAGTQIQRDLAIEPPNLDAIARELSEEEIQDAIAYNTRRFKNEAELRNLRDVLGIPPDPAVIDEELILAVVQWQAENNLTQDGKIGPRLARVIGREMLAESSLDPSQRSPAIRMLERGITLYFTNNRYNDTANTSQKLIGFNVFIPEGLNMRDYALVNFLRGRLLFMPGPTSPTVRMYGSNVPFNFPSEQVDSVDADPIYWSDASARWNYSTSGRVFSATDDPGRPNNVFNPGDTADVHFRIGVFRISDLPATTSGNVGSARPIVSANWRFSVARDASTGVISHP